MRNTYLLAFAVHVDPERRVFFLEPVERTSKVGSFIADRLDGWRNDRFRDKHRGLRMAYAQEYVLKLESSPTIE
jgi:hypothetical protein